MIDIVPWLPFAGLVCVATGISWSLYAGSFYCRDNPSMLPGAALVIVGAILIGVGASRGAHLLSFVPNIDSYFPAPPPAPCQWINTSTSTAWVCPRGS